jgi:hypothetical protein
MPAPFETSGQTLKELQRLQNKVLSITDNFLRRKPTRELHEAFNIPYAWLCHKVM